MYDSYIAHITSTCIYFSLYALYPHYNKCELSLPQGNILGTQLEFFFQGLKFLFPTEP